MNIDIKTVLSGRFRLEKRKRNSGNLAETTFSNIVLDVGKANLWERAKAGQDVKPEYLFFGTGTTTPTAADTGLESVSGTLPGKLANSSKPYDGTSLAGGLGGTSTVMMTFEYTEGEAEGVWTELGAAYDSAYSNPYNRSLIKDDQGNPTSFTVLSDEFLTVYLTLSMEIELVGNTGSIDYNGTLYSYYYRFRYGSEPFSAFASTWSGSRNPGSIQFYLFYNSTFTQRATSFTTDADNISFTSPEIVFNPGVASTLLKFRFETISIIRSIEIIFDTPIPIPSDHQATVGAVTLTMNRGNL